MNEVKPSQTFRFLMILGGVLWTLVGFTLTMLRRSEMASILSQSNEVPGEFVNSWLELFLENNGFILVWAITCINISNSEQASLYKSFSIVNLMLSSGLIFINIHNSYWMRSLLFFPLFMIYFIILSGSLLNRRIDIKKNMSNS